MAHGKRYNEAKKLVDAKTLYSPEQATELVKKLSTSKFDGSVEVHVNLGIDPKKGDQQVRGTIVMPHATGKTKKVIAFVSAEKAKDAKEAGADIVGSEELIDEVGKSGKMDFDVAVATPDMMVKLSKIAKLLGPAGLMPNPKTDTVSPNVKKMVEDIKRGKVAFKNDDTANLHLVLGRVSMDANALLENLNAFMEVVKKAKPASAKGVYIASVTLAPTMGPGVNIDPAKFA